MRDLRAEALYDGGSVGLTLGGQSLTVPPLSDWPRAALMAASRDDYEFWARLVLSPADQQRWRAVDPTVQQCDDLFDAWEAATGEDIGSVCSLSQFLEEHAEALEADLRARYHVRLRDLYRGKLSYRELWVLVRHLPPESWTQTILRDAKATELLNPVDRRDDKFGQWGLINYQMASLTDAVRSMEYVLARVNGNEKFKVPDPTPRPGANRMVAKQPQANVLYLDSLRARG